MKILDNINNIITEARSHSDTNKRVTLFESLYQYRNKDYYVSFNNIEKIGLNPFSIWNGSTMLGIFAYPLDFILYYLRNYYSNMTNVAFLIDENVKYPYHPVFAANRTKNVYVLKRNDISDKEFVFVSKYNNFNRDYNIIKDVIDNDIIVKFKSNTKYYNILLKRRNDILSLMKENGGFKGIIKGLSKLSGTLIDLQIQNHNIKYINKKEFGIYITKFLINKLNYSGITDDNFSSSTLHYDIPFETIFLHPRSYQIVDSFQNKNYNILINRDDEWQQRLADMFKDLDVSHYEKYA